MAAGGKSNHMKEIILMLDVRKVSANINGFKGPSYFPLLSEFASHGILYEFVIFYTPIKYFVIFEISN